MDLSQLIISRALMPSQCSLMMPVYTCKGWDPRHWWAPDRGISAVPPWCSSTLQRLSVVQDSLMSLSDISESRLHQRFGLTNWKGNVSKQRANIVTSSHSVLHQWQTLTQRSCPKTRIPDFLALCIEGIAIEVDHYSGSIHAFHLRAAP